MVSKVVPYIAIELYHSDEVGEMVGNLGDAANFSWEVQGVGGGCGDRGTCWSVEGAWLLSYIRARIWWCWKCLCHCRVPLPCRSNKGLVSLNWRFSLQEALKDSASISQQEDSFPSHCSGWSYFIPNEDSHVGRYFGPQGGVYPLNNFISMLLKAVCMLNDLTLCSVGPVYGL